MIFYGACIKNQVIPPEFIQKDYSVKITTSMTNFLQHCAD